MPFKPEDENCQGAGKAGGRHFVTDPPTPPPCILLRFLSENASCVCGEYHSPGVNARRKTTQPWRLRVKDPDVCARAVTSPGTLCLFISHMKHLSMLSSESLGPFIGAPESSPPQPGPRRHSP